MSLPFDSALFGQAFGTPQMKAIWSDEGLIDSWLRVEVALAQAQAKEGLIPAEAAQAIAAVAQIDQVDVTRLAEGTQRGGMPIKPLVDQLAARGGPLVAAWLHWGATTQDILDTGQALRIQASLDHLDDGLAGLAGALIAMVEAHRHTPMVARTNAIDAKPTTWGLQVSTVLTEVVRHADRISALRPRACTGMLGGRSAP